MGHIELVFTLISIVVAVLIIVYALFKGKKINICDINLGPFTAKISENTQNVDKVELLSVPLAGCVGEVLTPPLKILLKDSFGKPVVSKKIRLEFYNENGLISSKNYSGKISALSDKNGIVVFNDLVLKRTGRYQIYLPIDNSPEVIDDIDVFPPGLDIDFWNEDIGSKKYEEKLNRVLMLTGKIL